MDIEIPKNEKAYGCVIGIGYAEDLEHDKGSDHVSEISTPNGVYER